MIVWVLIFLVILIVSFFLALQSMRNYQEDKLVFWKYNSIYLFQKEELLTESILNELIEFSKKTGSQLSLERLYKGEKSALVVFGPTTFFKDQLERLNLLELVDYTDSKSSEVTAWEITSAKDQTLLRPQTLKPKLLETEQFWWQVVAGVEGQIVRMVVSCDNPKRLAELTSEIVALTKHQGITLSNSDYQVIINRYKNRQLLNSPLVKLTKLSFLEGNKFKTTSSEILRMVGIS